MNAAHDPEDNGATQILRRPPSGIALAEPLLVEAAPPRSWLELPVFAGLPPEVLQRLVASMQAVELPAAATLMRRGEPGDALFILRSGKLRVQVPADDPTAEAMDRELVAPAIVGEMALITGEPRSADVTAIDDSRLLRMDQRVFADLRAEHPQMAVFLTCLVGERLLQNRGIRQVGKYQVVGRLGSGGVATVFEAVHPGLGLPVALKMLSHTLVHDQALAAHFGREGRMVAQFRHDNIVRVLDTEEAYGTRFIVMEKLDGDLLEHLIKRGERLPWPQVRRILIEIAEALAYAHAAGLIHRDVKPANVFMTEDKRVKLLDFGIALDAALDDANPDRLVGTPNYMAPEQILGQDLDARVDLYALGVLAFELCTLQLPYQADSVAAVFHKHVTAPIPDPRIFDPDMPEDLLRFIRRNLAKKPQDRFASAAESADFLRAAGDSTAGELIELSTLTLSYLPSRRSQVQLILREALEKLRRVRGVQVLSAHQTADRTAEEAMPPSAGSD